MNTYTKYVFGIIFALVLLSGCAEKEETTQITIQPGLEFTKITHEDLTGDAKNWYESGIYMLGSTVIYEEETYAYILASGGDRYDGSNSINIKRIQRIGNKLILDTIVEDSNADKNDEYALGIVRLNAIDVKGYEIIQSDY